jgi:outer membrane protein TolC
VQWIGRPRAALAFLAAALALAGPGARAEETPLTLAEALARAEQGNPEILAAREHATAATASAEATARMRWPQLSVDIGWTYSNTPAIVFAQKLNAGDFAAEDFDIARLNSPDALSHLTSSIGLQLPIDLFGKVGAAASGREAGSRAAQAAVSEGTLELRLNVVQAYRNAELARRAVTVTERALASARARENDIQARVDEGAALKADLLRARARRRQREAELAERRGQAAIATAMLGRLLGAAPGIELVPVDPPPEQPPALAGDESEWTTRALAVRPALAGAQARLEAQDWSREAEDRVLLPDLAVYGALQDDRSSFSSGGQHGIVGAMLRWNAFSPSRAKKVAAATAEQRAAELELRAASDQVRLEVETAWRRSSAARERWAAAAGGSEEGREALRVVQERRREGMATLTDELETEVAALAAELGEIQAAAEVAIADAALLRAAGALDAAALAGPLQP